VFYCVININRRNPKNLTYHTIRIEKLEDKVPGVRAVFDVEENNYITPVMKIIIDRFEGNYAPASVNSIISSLNDEEWEI